MDDTTANPSEWRVVIHWIICSVAFALTFSFLGFVGLPIEFSLIGAFAGTAAIERVSWRRASKTSISEAD